MADEILVHPLHLEFKGAGGPEGFPVPTKFLDITGESVGTIFQTITDSATALTLPAGMATIGWGLLYNKGATLVALTDASANSIGGVPPGAGVLMYFNGITAIKAAVASSTSLLKYFFIEV